MALTVLPKDTDNYDLHTISTNSFTLTGTEVTETDTKARALSARVHAQSHHKLNTIELWYLRDAIWSKFPIQPVVGQSDAISLSKAYREPATLRFVLPNEQGLLTKSNMNSTYNLNGASNYDPLLDEARKVLLRFGLRCYTNLSSGITPTSTLAPSAGALSGLTDGLLGDIFTNSTDQISFAPTSTATFTLKIDLGSVKHIRHIAIRFASKTTGTVCTFPATVKFQTSQDDVTYISLPEKPVFGNATVLGDWDNCSTGQSVELIETDIDISGRYVKFIVTPTGSQTIMIDELAVYGEFTSAVLGRNLFVGYLGDSIKIPSTPLIGCEARDSSKRLMDNNDVRLTKRYIEQDAADLCYLFLTDTAYWVGTNPAYDAPVQSANINWTYAGAFTDFKYPIWQSQNNSMLGYIYEILNSIGMGLEIDGNEVFNIRQPPYRRVNPHRIFITGDSDGNRDIRNVDRLISGRDLRNSVDVTTGKTNTGAFRTLVKNRKSVVRYGSRRTGITEPLAEKQEMRQTIANYFLRDYAWNLDKFTADIDVDFDTRIKSVYGARIEGRTKMYAKEITSGSEKRSQELWTIESLDYTISKSQFYANAYFKNYAPGGPPAIIALTATPSGTTIINLSWTLPTDLTDIYGYAIYWSSTSETTGYPSTPNATVVGSGSTTYQMTGLTNGTRYWIQVISLGPAPGYIEGSSSSIVSAVAGGGAGDDTGWAVTDLSVSFNQFVAPDNSDGHYTYEIGLLWTSPPVAYDAGLRAEPWYFGFKHAFYCYLTSAEYTALSVADRLLPKKWRYYDEWHGKRYQPNKGLNWDYTADGQLNTRIKIQSATSLSGVTYYFRMFTWQTTNGFGREAAHASNVVSLAIP